MNFRRVFVKIILTLRSFLLELNVTSAVAKILAGSDEIIRQETGFTNFPPKNFTIKKAGGDGDGKL